MSVILADHVRNVDWRVRSASKISTVDAQVFEEVIAKIGALIMPLD